MIAKGQLRGLVDNAPFFPQRAFVHLLVLPEEADRRLKDSSPSYLNFDHDLTNEIKLLTWTFFQMTYFIYYSLLMVITLQRRLIKTLIRVLDPRGKG